MKEKTNTIILIILETFTLFAIRIKGKLNKDNKLYLAISSTYEQPKQADEEFFEYSFITR